MTHMEEYSSSATNCLMIGLYVYLLIIVTPQGECLHVTVNAHE